MPRSPLPDREPTRDELLAAIWHRRTQRWELREARRKRRAADRAGLEES